MAVWKTCLILALCVLVLAALISSVEAAAASAKQEGSASEGSASEGSAGSESGGKPSKSSSKSGAPGLQINSVWLTVASLVGAGLHAGLYAPLARLASQ